MKSTVLALLPLAGLALAESVCQPKTVTKTVYAYEPESTSAAQVVKDNATPKPSAPTPTPSTCSRRTVTTTTVEKVTVTINPDDVTTTKYSTSTRTRTTTVTVRPSKAPVASSPAAVPNPSPTPAATPAASATSTLPNFMLVGSSKPAASYAEGPSAAPAPAPSSTKASQQPAASPKADSNTGTSAAGSKSGDTTFYGGNVAGGMCSFTGYTIPSNLFGTALSDSNWDGAQACGQCVKVTGPDGNQITAMVVDQCPNCGPNHLDLFPDAFAKLAEPSKGVIKTSWEFVPCGITSPIVLKNKSGTSKFWFSMQVMNSNVGVSKLEVSTDGGSSWKATTRQPYNFFENSSGFGTDSVDVKITSIDGKTIVVKDVSIADSTTKTAGENF